MKRLYYVLFVLLLLGGSFLFLPTFAAKAYAGGGHDDHGSGHGGYPGEVPFDRDVSEIKPFIAPMNELNIFPCTDCHDEDWESSRERRDLEEPHDEFPGKFVNHDSDNRWCLDCHSEKQRDKFQLINGDLVEYDEYYKVCEQCHKKIYREWKMGVHGKRTGHWNGDKQWMHCTQCHNPHNPPFQPIKPMPAPRKPLNTRLSSSADTH